MEWRVRLKEFWFDVNNTLLSVNAKKGQSVHRENHELSQFLRYRGCVCPITKATKHDYSNWTFFLQRAILHI